MLRTIRLVSSLLFLLVFLACSHTPKALNDSVSVLQTREDYLLSHPDGKYNQYIERGEVVRGMNYVQVSAAWGIPETRSQSKDKKFEYWTFVGHDDLSGDWTRYTFVFQKGVLTDWDLNRHFTKNGTLAQWSLTGDGDGDRYAEGPLPSNSGSARR
jgi:hypothetical protein